MKKIKNLNDKQALEAMVELLATKVKLGTAYVADPETGYYTHQFLVLSAGGVEAKSPPSPLPHPLMPAPSGIPAEELN